MPGYKAHVGWGASVYAVLLVLFYKVLQTKFSVFIALEWFFCCVLGALFPDIDIKSKGQGIFYRVVVVFLLFLLWRHDIVAFVFVSMLSFVPLLVHHRGLFHKPWFVVVMPFSIAFIACQYQAVPCTNALLINILFFSAGALSHIVLDRFQTKFKL